MYSKFNKKIYSSHYIRKECIKTSYFITIDITFNYLFRRLTQLGCL